MAIGDITWFAQALIDLGNKVHDLSADTIKLGIVTNATIPLYETAGSHWGGTGITNFAANQVALGTGYTGPITLTGKTWTNFSNNPTLTASPVTIPRDSTTGFSNGYYGIIYNDTDANKRALGFIDLGGGAAISNVPALISIDWSGAEDRILGLSSGVVEPPSTLATLLPGSWYEFPNSRMDAVDPCPARNCSYSGTNGQNGVMNAWSSGCYDTLRELLYCWGGGHANYGGNEIYAFGPLTSETPVWSRIIEPSVAAGNGAEVNSDGRPASRHTYNIIQYDPVNDRFMSLLGGSLFNMSSATGSHRNWGYDLATNAWISTLPSWSPGDVHNTASDWDPIALCFWGKNSFSNQVAKFNPAGNGGLGSWTGIGASWYSSPYLVMTVDTRRHNIGAIGGNVVNNMGLNIIDLDNNNARATPVTTGHASAIAMESQQAPGFVYDPVGDRYIGWKDGPNVYALNPESYEWTLLENSNAVTPGLAEPNGTYGRFRYVPSLGGCVLVNRNTNNVFFYKLHSLTPVTSFTITNTSVSTQTDQVYTLGHPFKQGDVPANCTLVAKTSTGVIVPLQCDRKATHADGSLRHAVLTVKLASQSPGAITTINLYTSVSGPDSAPILPTALVAAGFNAVVSILISGVAWTASASTLLTSTTPVNWLQGKEVNEWIVSAPLKDVSDNSHPHLTAYFHVRAYAGNTKARVQVLIENDWSYVASPTTYTYDLTVTVGGVAVLTDTAVRHYHHARWMREFWWGTAPVGDVKHNQAYFIATKAVPNYDTSIVPTETTLNSYTTRWATASGQTNDGDTNSKTGVMGQGIVHMNMPEVAGREDIGPVPAWTAAFLLSFDQRAKDFVLNTGRQALSWTIHYRNEATGRPTSLDEYPYMTLLGTHANSFNPSTGLYEDFPALVGDNTNPFTADQAHQPELAYVPYLITGDYVYLEELQFWANWNILRENPAYRGNVQGLIRHAQIRAQAWTMRELGWCAYITPDSHPLKSYFETRVENNIADYNQRFVIENPNIFGAAISSTNNFTFAYEYDVLTTSDGIAPWQDDYFTWSLGNLKDLGFTSVVPVLEWKCKFIVGRLTDPSFCYVNAAQYSMAMRDGASQPIWTSWAQVWENNYGALQETDPGDPTYLQFYRDQLCSSNAQAVWWNYKYGTSLVAGQFTANSSSPEYYTAYMKPAVAVAKDSGITNADLAYLRYSNAPNMPTDWMDGSVFKPMFAILPRT